MDYGALFKTPTKTATKVAPISFTQFLQQRQAIKTPIAPTIPKLVSKSPFNPNTSYNAEFNTQLDMRAGTQNTFKNFFSSLGGAFKFAGKSATELPIGLYKSFTEPTPGAKQIENTMQPGILKTLAKPLVRNFIAPSVEVFATEVGKDFGGGYKEKKTPIEELNRFLGGAQFGMAMAGLLYGGSKTLGDKLATSKTGVIRVTPAEIRTVLAEKPLTGDPMAVAYVENGLKQVADNGATLKIDINKPAGGVRQTIGEFLGGNPQGSKVSINSPFAHELVAPENKPFAHEATNAPFASEIASVTPKTAPETAITGKMGGLPQVQISEPIPFSQAGQGVMASDITAPALVGKGVPLEYQHSFNKEVDTFIAKNYPNVTGFEKNQAKRLISDGKATLRLDAGDPKIVQDIYNNFAKQQTAITPKVGEIQALIEKAPILVKEIQSGKYNSWADLSKAVDNTHTPEMKFGSARLNGVELPIEESFALNDWAKKQGFTTAEDAFQAIKNSTQAKKAAVDPLAQEATKYKTAEEFVKAQPKVYHGGTADIQVVDTGKSNFSKTFYLSDKADYAKSFGGNKSVVNEMVLDPKANLADMRKPSADLVSQIEAKVNEKMAKNVPYGDKNFSFHPFSAKDVIQGLKDGKAHFAELPEVKTILKELGYDGQITAEVPYAKNIGVWNKEIVKTKSQLTDIWNKATQPLPTPTEKPIEGNKTSGIAQSINAKAIEQGMTTKGFDDLAEFNGTSFKEQADLVSKLPEYQAKAIVRGEQPLPPEIRSAALISAMEDLAKKTGDVQLMQDLANSPLATKISESASEVSLARMREQDSATMKLQEIKKAREARTEKTKPKELQKTAKSLKAETEKVNLSADELSWERFLEDIKC